MFSNKVLLITGSTGSFGNAVLNRFLNTDVKEIRIFRRDEKKQEYLRIKLNNSKVKFYIGVVRISESVNSAMQGVDYVFHAAALKQVPSCEFYPMESIRTNVLGAENVLNVSIANGVEKVFFLSTDKAVYPINAMGLSKALYESQSELKLHRTNGLANFAVKYGIHCFLLYFFLMLLSFKKYCIINKFNPIFSCICIGLIFIIGFSETYFQQSIFISLIYFNLLYPEVHINNKRIRIPVLTRNSLIKAR